jgi:poly-gamma-glutamate capsule biosynthesis protein CapA/YwtB (metallophosphatase superfamily)
MDVAQAEKLLDEMVAALALPPASPLTAKQQRQITKARKGMERVIPKLASLSVTHGVSVPKQSTSDMTSNLELANQLEPIQQKLMRALTLVGNHIGNARGASWGTATTLYGMLKKAAHRDPEIRTDVAPLQEFFAYRHSSVKKNASKQTGNKAALKAAQQTAAQAEATPTVQETPAAPAATASTDARAGTNGAATANGVTSHGA